MRNKMRISHPVGLAALRPQKTAQTNPVRDTPLPFSPFSDDVDN